MNVEPEKIQALISILQSMLVPNDEPESGKQNTTKRKKSKNKTVESKTINKKVFQNKFDSMPESGMHKADIAIDKKLAVHPPVPRARPFELISVNCRVCGKKENINPSLLNDPERHKCNKCSASSG